PPPLLPAHATLVNYRTLFANAGIGRYFVNSLLLALGATLLSLLFNVGAGYAFAKLHFRGRDRLFRLLIGALVIPGQVAMLPLFSFLGCWNDFMWPLIVLTDKDMYTLPVAIASLSDEHVQDSELMMAGSVLTIVPVLLIFIGLQRYYLQGLLMGSVKG